MSIRWHLESRLRKSSAGHTAIGCPSTPCFRKTSHRKRKKKLRLALHRSTRRSSLKPLNQLTG
ncbi:MAG: hypothetical protein ACP5HU_00415 [Phycisphaerae bacterium]